MFNLFRKKPIPPFPRLESSPHKDKYFYRVAEWTWVNSKKRDIHVVDPCGPRMLTLDAWPQLVFLAADGTLTVNAYVASMARQYSGKVPHRLDETILKELDTLLDYQLIQLNQAPRRPDPLFDSPGASGSR